MVAEVILGTICAKFNFRNSIELYAKIPPHRQAQNISVKAEELHQ